MIVLGLKIVGHDTGAALIAHKKVVAIAEERLNRVKHSPHIFPEKSIIYCLETLNIRAQDVEIIVIDQIGLSSDILIEKTFREWDRNGSFQHAKVHVINHHDAHAASAFFCSPFERAAILVYDGSGEVFTNQHGIRVAESETLYAGNGNSLQSLQKTTHTRLGTSYPYTWGIGKLYTFFSNTYLRFGPYNEGKMMGLSAYGTDVLLKRYPLVRWYKEFLGHYICNAQIIYPRELASYKSIGAYIAHIKKSFRIRFRNALKQFAHSFLRAVYSKHTPFFSTPTLFTPINLDRPPRNPEKDKLPDEYYASVAYMGQKILEAIAFDWAMRLKAFIPDEKNLCVAGGVGLNIDVNKQFLDKAGFSSLFVQPAASDTGIALGCALFGYHAILKQPRFWCMESASLGRPYTDSEIEATLNDYTGSVIVSKEKEITVVAAELIADGKILGWFQGGAEYGPRALGNRSIICDARNKDMKDILNNRVKHRESWRPFAASVLLNHISDWFDIMVPSPHMLLAADVRKDKQSLIPSVVHIDGTCRLQSVTEANGRYFELIDAFYKKTQVPLVINTSFNLGGDPIVETPRDAIETFLKTDLDFLIIEDYLIRKK